MPHLPCPDRAMLSRALMVAAATLLCGCSSARFAMNEDLRATPSRQVPGSGTAHAQRQALGRPPTPAGHAERPAGPTAPAAAPSATEPTALTRSPQSQPLHAAAPVDGRHAGHPAAPAPSTPAAPALPRGAIIVQPGDTLYVLSRRHGVSISALMDANGLTSLALQPGQVLRLPRGHRPLG